jgi:hypothetical protein
MGEDDLLADSSASPYRALLNEIDAGRDQHDRFAPIDRAQLLGGRDQRIVEIRFRRWRGTERDQDAIERLASF